MSEAQDLPGHDQLARLTHTQSPAWDRLLQAVSTCPKGRGGEDQFHKNVEKLLSTMFWPSLTSPEIEYKIHEGRKRIDIAYVNQANHGGRALDIALEAAQRQAAQSRPSTEFAAGMPVPSF